MIVVRNREGQLLVHCYDSGSATLSEVCAFPVAAVVDNIALNPEERILRVFPSPRDELVAIVTCQPICRSFVLLQCLTPCTLLHEFVCTAVGVDNRCGILSGFFPLGISIRANFTRPWLCISQHRILPCGVDFGRYPLGMKSSKMV